MIFSNVFCYRHSFLGKVWKTVGLTKLHEDLQDTD